MTFRRRRIILRLLSVLSALPLGPTANSLPFSFLVWSNVSPLYLFLRLSLSTLRSSKIPSKTHIPSTGEAAIDDPAEQQQFIESIRMFIQIVHKNLGPDGQYINNRLMGKFTSIRLFMVNTQYINNLTISNSHLHNLTSNSQKQNNTL